MIFCRQNKHSKQRHLIKKENESKEIMESSVNLKSKFKTNNENNKTIDLKKVNPTQMGKKTIIQ